MMIHFNLLPTKEMLYDGLDSIQFHGGDARLQLGLLYAQTVFTEPYGDRETAPNFLIVISGGKSSEPHKTKAMSARLARKGVKIYAIGLGASADKEELKTIVYPSIHIFYVENSEDLSSIKDHLVGDICRDWNRTQTKV
ncbi:hypothetical protein RRG08_052834 [Elysia crispata]|uniref:VWFA domain-containing protein n=1 Tax=Elysia crispata TaxID=231223 RepID=A0AAE1A5B9_9GAST|nr:hypothetical protein RRG08_052834 [Elysia crispata]